MTGRKVSSDKEIKAMTLNQKEDRVLAKTFDTLELERKFAENVLNLRLRTIKSNYRHLKDKVSKIKSQLTPEEITVYRQLEQEGLMKPMTTLNLNAAMKIAVATKRLNVYPEGTQRSKSAFIDRHTKSLEWDKLLPNRSNTDTDILTKERHSVVGLCIDNPSPEKTERRNSADSKMQVQVKVRPISAVAYDVPSTTKTSNIRPTSSMWLKTESTSLSTMSFQSNSPKLPKSQHEPISLHEAAKNEVTSLLLMKDPRDRKPSIVTADDSLEPNLGADLFDERRQELLQEEQLFNSNLLKRKTIFIGKIETYLDNNPPVK